MAAIYCFIVSSMKTILWASDLHLNLAKDNKIDDFIIDVNQRRADLLLLTGDLTEAPLLHEHLKMLSEKIKIPIYFILGNHDYYKSSVETVTSKLKKFIKNQKNIFWLTESDLLPLGESSCLIGCENWWDGYFGSNKQTFLQEFIMRQDYKEIKELSVPKKNRIEVLRELNSSCMKKIITSLNEALLKFDNVYLAVHVPPFQEACSFADYSLSEEWLFHFCCYSLGQHLINVMNNHHNKQLTVLCGHTHSSAYFKPASNITVLTAKASYRKPKIYTSITISK